MGQTNDDTDAPRALHERIAHLEAELADIRRLAPTTSDQTERATDQTSDRRQLLRRVGTVAAGAVAGGAALAATQASPAAAADGDFLKLGNNNTATAQTTVDGASFRVSNDNNALIGQTSGTASARAVVASATAQGIGVFASSAEGAPLHISNGSQVIPPQAGTWIAGQFLIAGSHLFYCYVGGTGPASKWARLSATFVPLASPTRIYDSRAGLAPLGVVKGKLADHQERAIDTKLGNAVPQGASAVVVNLTATDTNPGGFLAAFKNGVAWAGTSSVNWFQSGSTVANQCTVAVDGTAQFRVRCEGAGGANFVVDVVGYYL